MLWWRWKPTSFQSPRCCKWGFPVAWAVWAGLCSPVWCSMVNGIIFSTMRCWKETAVSIIASAFLMQQGVPKFNRHVKWEVFLWFEKKCWQKRGVEDFLSSTRSRVSPNTCMVYWDTFLLNFHSRGQQVEDHISQWENLLRDTPSKWFERVWLYVQVPANASCTSLPGWKPSCLSLQ